MEREPRVERIAADSPAAEPMREAFNALIRERGAVPNLFRVAAHRPEITRTLQGHLMSVMGPGQVSQMLKELLSVRVSRVNACDYCLASHTTMAIRRGANDGHLGAVRDGDYTTFEPGWRAAFQVADAMTEGDGHVDAKLFAEFARHWNAAQIVEIVAVISAFSMYNRFANALEIPPTK